MLARTKRVSA